MPTQISIVRPEFCIDSCVFFDFWNVDDPLRSYGMDGFEGHWKYIEGLIAEGKIIAPTAVKEELLKTSNAELAEWLKQHDHMFVELNTSCITWLAKITQKYQAYTRSAFGREPTDAIIIALAKSEGLTVLTSENFVPTHNPEKPKIPNVCSDKDINVPCVNVRKFFSDAKISYEIKQQQ